MPLSDDEIESCRVHLGYGAVGISARPYTPDGFYEVFKNVIQPHLREGARTTSSTAVSAAGIATITPASMTGIVPHARLVCDVGEDSETVVVRSVGVTTFTARFASAHLGTGWPVEVESGVTQARVLIHAANRARAAMTSAKPIQSAGIQSLGKGEIVWFGGAQVLREMLDAYMTVVAQLSQLLRVPHLWDQQSRRSSALEVY